MSLTVERADYLRTPGRRADLTIGPLTFTAVTADEGHIGLWIRIGWLGFGWEVSVWPR